MEEADEARVFLISPKQDICATESSGCLDGREIGRIAHDYRADSAVDSGLHKVRSSWKVDHRRLARRSELSRVACASAVTSLDGLLNGGCVVGGAITLGAVVLDVPEHGPALPVCDGRTDAIVVDTLIPISGRTLRSPGGTCQSNGECENGE